MADQKLTNSSIAEFRLVGQSRAVANLSIGQITLDPIKVNVSTSLNGLRGLNGFTTINTVDVTGGTTEAINLGIEGEIFTFSRGRFIIKLMNTVAIFNPSNLNLSTGDLSKSRFPR